MIAVKTLAEFEDAVKNLPPIANTHLKLYRGQADDWELLPNLFRYYRKNVHMILDKEKISLDALKKLIPLDTPMIPRNDWDWLSFGQHYGLKTRMLDWSERPLIALYFALERRDAPNPTIYVYHAQKHQIVNEKTKHAAFASVEHTRIMKPAVHSVRVALQKGWHTVHLVHRGKKTQKRTVIPLAKMDWHVGRMRVVKVDPSCVRAMRLELDLRGINRATVYGEFENVCSIICRNYLSMTTP